jgi:hypothetical protein
MSNTPREEKVAATPYVIPNSQTVLADGRIINILSTSDIPFILNINGQPTTMHSTSIPIKKGDQISVNCLVDPSSISVNSIVDVHCNVVLMFD